MTLIEQFNNINNKLKNYNQGLIALHQANSDENQMKYDNLVLLMNALKLPNSGAVVIEFNAPYNGTILYKTNSIGYYTINNNLFNKISMPTGDNQSINLTNKGANKITIVCLELTMLNLTNCGLKTMPDFHTFIHLEKLYLKGNTNIGAALNAINGTNNLLPTSLTFLDLNNCGLTAMPSFSSFSNLANLYLGNNLISSIITTNLPPTETLRLLDLQYCSLTAMPDFRTFTKLYDLNLTDNPLIGASFTTIETVQAAINRLPTSLTYLYLTNCGLKTMPDFRTFSILAELNLTDNPFIGASFTNAADTVQAAINRLPTSLTKLYLTNCSLTAMPDFRGFSNLSSLALSYNPLIGASFTNAAETLQAAINTLPTSLTVLYLTNCSLTAMPNFSTFSNLAELALSINPLIGGSFTIDKVPTSLTLLSMRDCGLTTIPDLRTFNQLAFISLRYNNIPADTLLDSRNFLPTIGGDIYIIQQNNNVLLDEPIGDAKGNWNYLQ